MKETTIGTDLEVMNWHSEALRLREYATSRIIRTIDDTKKATEDLSVISKLKKAMEERRKEYIKPFQDKVKSINDTYKMLMEPIDQADKITRDKVLAFRAEQERLHRETEEINRQKEELARREAALHYGEVTIDTTPVEVAPEPPKHIYTDLGTASTPKVRKWEITDSSLVPDEYKIIDVTKIGKLVRAGIPSIPGIRIWEEETLRVTTRK